jgi:hypothetical protein
VPTTSRAPIALAICMPIRPTPELAPWNSTASPTCIAPLVITASCIVCSATGKVAAWVKVMLLAGIGATRPRSATAYSAQACAPEHITRSPGLNSVALAPVSTTSPDHSSPTMVPAPPERPCACPDATPTSARLSPAARTFTSTSSGPGFGTGTSAISTPPAPTMAAFIACLP